MRDLSTSFSATGSSSDIPIERGVVSVSGTFVGTVVVEVDPLGNGNWVGATDSSGVAIGMTAPTALRIDNGVSLRTRLRCSVFTSGTIVAAIRGT